jgi:hypothetical protein
MRRVLLALLLLGVAAFAADRVALLLAERAMAERLKADGVSSSVTVEIRELPFLTQVVRGRYDQVFVRAEDVQGDEVTLSVLEATLVGARVPLSDALADDVDAVPVDAVRATVVVPYAELTRRTEASEVTVMPLADRLLITGEVEVLGRTISASAESTVELSEGSILVTAQSFDVGSGVVNGLLTKALRGVFDRRIPLEGLPYGLVPSGLEVTERGIALDAFASDTVLTRP